MCTKMHNYISNTIYMIYYMPSIWQLIQLINRSLKGLFDRSMNRTLLRSITNTIQYYVILLHSA